jgi:hypothetical protein
MANNKTGFNYYNVDTDRYQDIRIKRLKKDFGCTGIAVYDYILSEVYRDKGCFSEWDESRAFDVAEYFGLKESTVEEIVKYCGVVGLFEKGLLSRGIVTSQSIQKRYLEMCVRAKRNNCKIPDAIKIQEESKIITEETAKLPEECTQNSCSLPQSKVKESKVNKRKKREIREKPEQPVSPPSSNVKIDFQRLLETYHSCCPLMPKVKELTTQRKVSIEARNKEHGKNVIFEVLKKAGASKFLNGENDRGFIAGFDWIFKPSNFVKILEGNYDNREVKKEKITYKPPKNENNLEEYGGMSPDYERYKERVNQLVVSKKMEEVRP